MGRESSPLLESKAAALAETSPEDYRSCGASVFFSWLDPIMELGATKPLEFEDLYQLDRCNRAENVSARFEHFWKLEQPEVKPSLPWALTRAFGVKFFWAGLLRFVRDSLQFVAPFVIKRMIAFLRTPDAPATEGWLLVSLIFLSGIIQSFCFRQYLYFCRETGLQLRTAVVTKVYAKTLRLSTKALQERSTGEIANLVSIDASRLQRLTQDLHTVWVVPYLLVVACALLYAELGVAFAAGLAVILLVIPLTLLLSRVMRRLQKSLMAVKDRRVKLCYEVLAGIKVIKLQAWELSFAARVLALRDAELATLRRYVLAQASSSAVYTGVPSLVAVASLGAYVAQGHTLDVGTALTSVALFNVLRFPLFKLPQVLNSCIEAWVSARRLQAFFLAPERRDVTPGDLTTAGLAVDAAAFGFGATPLLRDVSLRAGPGELVAIVGPVGSGKSTLLQGLLGDTDCLAGAVHRRGSVAYVAQQPFVQNATLRTNVTFGRPFDAARYERALAVSCLAPDLAVLPHGDRTEIGEKGITLSGGQRTRVALARAMYMDADVYLLDDVLAAVDSHVGADLFRHCVLELRRTKVVVLVTNQLGVLRHCDQVLVLGGGSVVEAGAFPDLAAKPDGVLATMLASFHGGALAATTSSPLASPL
ncbi:ATP-binding Cassette (ABC) Superfamily, partial [Achlya hypogyna]